MKVSTEKVYNLKLTEEEMIALHMALGNVDLKHVNKNIDETGKTARLIYAMYEMVRESLFGL